MQAILRQTRISPKKANLVAGLVRGKNAKEALNLLKFTPKKGAKILAKVVKSAMATAENNFKQNPDNLYIKEIIVNEGTTYKRSISCSRGRMHPILKRNSHITVKIDVKEPEIKPEEPVAEKTSEEPKAEEASEENSTTTTTTTT